MLNWLLGKNAQVRIEVETGAMLLVLDRSCDSLIVPWEDAFTLSQTMDQAIQDWRQEFMPTDSVTTLREQGQIRLAHHKGLVALVMDWTDRIRFTSLDAFFLTARALRKTAQDSHLEGRGVIFRYDRKGMIAKLHTIKTQTTQHVR